MNHFETVLLILQTMDQSSTLYLNTDVGAFASLKKDAQQGTHLPSERQILAELASAGLKLGLPKSSTSPPLGANSKPQPKQAGISWAAMAGKTASATAASTSSSSSSNNSTPHKSASTPKQKVAANTTDSPSPANVVAAPSNATTTAAATATPIDSANTKKKPSAKIEKSELDSDDSDKTTSLKKKTPQPDMKSYLNTSQTKIEPLGIVLLRIMFDPAYLFNATKNNKADLVIPHGLSNSGNICYMNSILQFLFSCQPFSQMLNLIRKFSVSTLGKTPILDSLLLLHESFKKPAEGSTVAVIDPHQFYLSIAKLPRFSHLIWGRQEDAEEFLGHLLDGLHEEFLDAIKSLPDSDVQSFAKLFADPEVGKQLIKAVEFIKDEAPPKDKDGSNDGWKEMGPSKKPSERRTMEVKNSPIVTLFGGQFKSVLKSSNKKSSITMDPFMQVQLDIDGNEINDLVSAFKRFSKDEEISMGKNTAKKQNFIDKVPEVLIIHLKRFSFVTYEVEDDDESSFSEVSNKKKKNNNSASSLNVPSTPAKAKQMFCRIEKITKFISYDYDLTLPEECTSRAVTEPPKYELASVVYHHGRDTENGHYTTEAMDSNGDWIKIDDTSIVNLRQEDVISDKTAQSKTAYILMYRKV